MNRKELDFILQEEGCGKIADTLHKTESIRTYFCFMYDLLFINKTEVTKIDFMFYV